MIVYVYLCSDDRDLRGPPPVFTDAGVCATYVKDRVDKRDVRHVWGMKPVSLETITKEIFELRVDEVAEFYEPRGEARHDVWHEIWKKQTIEEWPR